MNGNLFRGELVRLTAEEPELLGKTFSSWDRDSEFRRLLDDEPPCLWSAKKIKEWFEKDSYEGDESGLSVLHPHLAGRSPDRIYRPLGY